jgi:predicted NBD/HSP70 family sugar kinase
MTGVTSHGYLLELVRASGGLSRQQLVESTGMSRGTLYSRLDTLTRLGLVYEAESLGATGGRRARRIRFENRGRVVLAIDLGQTHARISVTDLIGTELRRAALPLRVEDGAAAVLGPVLDHSEKLAARGSGELLVGVGVGVPAATDPGTGSILHPTTLVGWPAEAVVAAVGARWDLPLVVENDARAAAVGECRSDEETLVYVKVATGIGCGIVVGGDVLRGASGVAGDLGHVRAAGVAGERRCRCGRTGCLAAYSSGRALLERLDPYGVGSLSEVGRRIIEPPVADELAAVAGVLGATLATTVTTVNPHRVVLGGALGVLPALVDGVREQIDGIVTELARPAVEGSTLGDRATIRGLARLVTRRVYAPEAVDAAIARGPGPQQGDAAG